MTTTKYPTLRISLPPPQWKWLEKKASDYKLSNVSKAIRCCVTCVALGDAPLVASAEVLGDLGQNTVEKNINLSPEQLQWIEAEKKNHGVLSASRFLQRIVGTCMTEVTEYIVFGVIRCKSTIAKCDGAQEAVMNIKCKFQDNEAKPHELTSAGCSRNCGLTVDGIFVKENIQF